jgi:hypothetical protein
MASGGPILNWLADAANQDYPLKPVAGGAQLTTGVTLNRRWLLDLGLTWGIISDYRYQTPTCLTHVSSDGTHATFVFAAAGLSITFTFVVPLTSKVTTVTSVDAALSGTPAPQYGFGILQTGDLSTMPTGNWTLSYEVEPTLIQTLDQHQLLSLNLANVPTTIVQQHPCLDHSHSSSYAPVVYSTDPVPLGVALTGDIQFAGGYFVQLNLDPVSDTITVNVADQANLSDQIPCDIPSKLVYPPGYTPPAQPECKDLIFAVNGLLPDQSNVFTWTSSPGVTFSLQGPHALTLEINQNLLFSQPPITSPCSSTSPNSSGLSSISSSNHPLNVTPTSSSP